MQCTGVSRYSVMTSSNGNNFRVTGHLCGEFNGDALLAICTGNSPVTGEFSAQRPVTRSFDVFLDLRLNQRLGKQWWGWWFETPSSSLWRHCNEHCQFQDILSSACRWKIWNKGHIFNSKKEPFTFRISTMNVDGLITIPFCIND